MLVDYSCTKSDAQNLPDGTQQIGKILFYKKKNSNAPEIWTSNYDGSGQTRINLQLPGTVFLVTNFSAKLSPDGSKVYFNAIDYSCGQGYQCIDIYSANIDGTAVTKIIDSQIDEISLSDVY